MSKLRRSHADAYSREATHHMAGRPDPEDGSRFRDADPHLFVWQRRGSSGNLAGDFESLMGVSTGGGFGYARRRSRLDRPAGRLAESRDDQHETRVLEKKRRTVWRECRFDRVLR